MASETNYRYDVFISYSHQDKDWVEQELLPRLEGAALQVCIDRRDFEIGTPALVNMERAVDRSRHTLLVLTPAWVKSEYCHFESMLGGTSDPAGRRRKLFPIMLEDCTPPPRISMLTWADFREPDKRVDEFERLSRQLRQSVNLTHPRDFPDPELEPSSVLPGTARPSSPGSPALSRVLTIDSPVKMEFIQIPAGEFLMGSDSEKDHLAPNYEQPQSRLKLSQFYIGKYPVTNEQFATFLETRLPVERLLASSSSYPPGREKHPAVEVTWHDAEAFCKWLATIMGCPVRLPSEAEWEKAARGTDGRQYPWGKEFLRGHSNCQEAGTGDTTEVDAFPKGVSPYGVFDMSGNIWEWTLSLWGASQRKPDYGYPYHATDGRENLDSPDSVLRVVRGGSFRGDSSHARCTSRNGGYPNEKYDYIGFRVLIVP
jgi:formylglycine-generating enzyme required for sulfatase activity